MQLNKTVAVLFKARVKTSVTTFHASKKKTIMKTTKLSGDTNGITPAQYKPS